MSHLSIDSALQPDCPYVDKNDPWSSHSQIKAWLADMPVGTKVLDIGAATGTLGKQLSGAGFVLHGIEPHAAWAEMARPHYADLRCGTLDDVGDAFLSGHNVVVCADVLEHMAHPEQALRRLLSFQPAGCRLLISVPNIANLWIRLNLLMGRFDYTDRGILDRTHLRFFTQRTLKTMLNMVGVRVVQLSVSPIPLDLVHPLFRHTSWGRAVHAGLARITRAFPRLLGYQFVVRAVKL
jgi:2-polyprenyl-3-methyl-5-hydroxy-6-metoxy-1,4-benzoquinol methylase